MSEFKVYNTDNLKQSNGKVSRPPACKFCKEKKYKVRSEMHLTRQTTYEKLQCDRNDNEGIYRCLQCTNRNLNCEIKVRAFDIVFAVKLTLESRSNWSTTLLGVVLGR